MVQHTKLNATQGLLAALQMDCIALATLMIKPRYASMVPISTAKVVIASLQPLINNEYP